MMSAILFQRRIGFAFVFSFLAFSAPVFAAPVSLVYNTNQPDFGSFPGVFAGQWLTQPFTTGANPALFNSATIYEKTFTTDGNFWLSIYSDNNGAPGSVLTGGLLNGPSQPTGFSFRTYTATQAIPLTANTRYWIVAAGDGLALSGGAYGWANAANNNYTSPVDWTLGYWGFTQDSGATWSLSENFNPGRLLTAINGTVVPEPSVATTLLGSLPILLAFRKKRQKQN
jgi:hypothetical protein